MASYSALDPVSAAVYTTLNVAAVTALATGGVGDAIEQRTGFPYVLYEVWETNRGGLGSKPGSGQRLLELDLRVHVFDTYLGFKTCQEIMAQVITLLATAPAVTGYSTGTIFHDETIPLPGQLVAGVSVSELVGMFRWYVTETP